MNAAPELKFYKTIRLQCQMSRRSKDPREALVASELEIEIEGRIHQIEETEKAQELEHAGAGGGRAA